MNPRHSVVIITYNQEQLIGRAIDSLLCQVDLLYEIIISDDCSKDRTWDVIQEYQKKYPEIIKPFRNAENLGIFGNIESALARTTGDVIWDLSGDDTFCDGLFKEANKLISANHIDWVNDAFTVYFDYVSITPSGIEKRHSNSLIEKYNPVGLKIRQLISNRTAGYSRKVLDQFYPVRKDIGIHADGLLDIQVQLFSEKNFYSSFVGSYYYTDIGIASKTLKKNSLESYFLSLEQLKTDIKNISKGDLEWLTYLQKRVTFYLNPSFKNYYIYVKSLFHIMKDFYGFRFLINEIFRVLKDLKKVFISSTTYK